MPETLTTSEVAERLRIHPKTVARHAARLGIGMNFGGRAGYRFTEDDYQALLEAMKVPPPPPPIRRQRRRHREF